MKKERCAGMYSKTMAFACLLFALTQNGCVSPEVPPVQSTTPGVTAGILSPIPKPTPTQPIQSRPEKTPAPTNEAVPTVTPKGTPAPTKELSPTGGPVPEVTPTEKPVPTAEVTEGRVTPEVLPTAAPEYEVLLQNGWQRTGDFFDYREILFPGRLNCTELLTEKGRYEYRYTSEEDTELMFCIIGETDVTIQPFLDSLEQLWTDCLITAEGEDDYTYTYADKDLIVKGRVYACHRENGTDRMRVELYYPADRLQAEGYEFYLR